MTAVANSTARDTKIIYRVVSGKALSNQCGLKDKATPEDVADLVRTLRAEVAEAKFVARRAFEHFDPPPVISESGVRLGLLRSASQSATTQCCRNQRDKVPCLLHVGRKLKDRKSH